MSKRAGEVELIKDYAGSEQSSAHALIHRYLLRVGGRKCKWIQKADALSGKYLAIQSSVPSRILSERAVMMIKLREVLSFFTL
jgi:hypothetical protein